MQGTVKLNLVGIIILVTISSSVSLPETSFPGPAVWKRDCGQIQKWPYLIGFLSDQKMHIGRVADGDFFDNWHIDRLFLSLSVRKKTFNSKWTDCKL